jgi:hypothetical protein
VAAAFNHPFLTKIYKWFSEQIVKLTALGVQEGMALETARPEPDRHSKIRDLLQFADLGIRDYRIRKTPSVGNDSGPEFEFTKHLDIILILNFFTEKMKRLISSSWLKKNRPARTAFMPSWLNGSKYYLKARSFWSISWIRVSTRS